jgi:hypothetical protein
LVESLLQRPGIQEIKLYNTHCRKNPDMAPYSSKPVPARGLLHFSDLLTTFLVGMFLFCCSSAIRLSGQSNASAAAHTDTLRGTVINSVTHEPIGRALVHSPDNRFATMTGDRGQFEFNFPRSEPGQLVTSASTLSAPGSVRESRLQYVSSNRPTNLMAAKPGYLFEENEGQGALVSADQQVLTIALTPEALVVGHILLPSVDYLDRIQVELYRREHQQGEEHWAAVGTTRSRVDGSFRFAELPAGTYKLVTRELLDRDPLTFDPGGQLFGYAPVYYPSAPDFAAAEVIRLSAGTTFQANLSPIRREYYRVKVGVANAPPNIQLQVWPHGRPGPGYSLGFNAEEQSIEGSLPDGNYTIRATSYGPAGMTGTLNIAVGDGPTTGATMMLLPNSSIRVSVTEEFVDPETLNRIRTMYNSGASNPRRPNYFNVSLAPIEQFAYIPGASLRPPNGPDDESLVIENVQPGSYRVQATTGMGYISSITSGGGDLVHKPLLVSPGSAPPAIEINLRDDGAEVNGTVEVPSQGSTFRLPVVHFVPMADGGGQFRVAWASGDGRFQLQQLPPGAYRVLVFDRQRPDLEYATDEVLSQYDSKAQVIRVVAGQKEHLRLPLISRSE